MIIIKKIRINKITLNSDGQNEFFFYNVSGYYDTLNKIIFYQEDDKLNTEVKIKFNKNNIIFHRENSKIKIAYNFCLNNKTKCIIYIKDLNINLEGTVETERLIIEKEFIYIKYKLQIDEQKQYEFSMQFEEE